MISSESYRPAFNDPERHSLLKGSRDYYSYWQKQHDRCINGFTPTGGTRISGAYYFYLNFCTIDIYDEDTNRKVAGNPYYRDQDHEYFNAIEDAEKNQSGLIILKARRKGFEQPHSEIVKGEFGDISMGDLKIGDKVWTHKGILSKVVDKFPQGEKEVYEVCLMDGRKVRCGIDHLWEVHTYWKNKWHKKIMTTEKLIDSGLYYNIKNNYRSHKYYIAPIKSVEYTEKELPINPYLLGCLIGDGNIKGKNKTPAISSADKEILDEIQKILGDDYELNRDGDYKYRIVYKKRFIGRDEKYGDNFQYGVNPLKRAIKELKLNIGSHDKFIPEIYKYSSVEQRMELIRGLMDTDGTIAADGTGTMYESQSGQLIKDVLEVFRSLGIKCSHGATQSCGTQRINIRTNEHIFKLPRKLDRLKNSDVRRWEHTAIIDIKKLDYKEESSCILIDDEDHVYLTTDYVPTHNSFNNVGILLHDWSFFPNSVSAVASEKEDFVYDFRKRMMKSYNRLDAKFKLKMISGTGEDLEPFISGYKEKKDGEWVKKGFGSETHFRIAKDEGCFRGLSLKYMFVEEAGEVKKLKRLYTASEECFKEGSHQFGIPIIGGTSNQLSHESKDFQEMFFSPEKYNLKSLFIPASKVFKGYFDMKTGKSDVVGATKKIMEIRAKKKDDKTSYYTYMQEMPLEPKDAFQMLGNGAFNLEKINQQKGFLLTDSRAKKVLRGNLEWPRTKEGKMIVGAKPKFVEDEDGVFEFVDGFMDPTNFQYAHVGGVDSYYIDDEFEDKGTTEKGQKSKGSMIIYRRFLGVNQVGNIPVAKYRDRPATKDIFCENCYKLACFYDSQILVEYTDSYFLKYFEIKNAMRYIKERPMAADAPTGKPTNRYGVHMTGYHKNLVADLLEKYVDDFIDNIFFVSLLEDLAKFGIENTDEAMAFGMCLIHDMDLVHLISKPKEDEKEETLFSFARNNDGSITYIDGSMGRGNKSPTLDYDFD